MPDLLLGPLLRYVSGTEATVWVETSEQCEVEVLGRREPTFGVGGHHYALVRIDGLEPGGFYEYDVSLDGEQRWPPRDSDLPPSAIRTFSPGKPVDICFGSCRVALPHEEPYTLSKDQHPDGHELDALRVLAQQMTRDDRDNWPELLFLLGDQVYVDEGSPATRERIRARRDTSAPPGEEVVDFEEYTWLYREAWEDPLIRWLFSTVSTSMVWDDHDMSDDWNISRSWHEEMERKDWWHERAIGGIVSYWIYQHIGNLSPRELDEENEIYAKARGNPDATEVLRDWAKSIDSTAAGTRWSFCRDIDGVRAIFMDARAARVLTRERRSMFDDEVWDWIVDHASGDFDHLVIGTTVPYLLTPPFHRLEAWNERLADDGVWGGVVAKASEKLRRALDFDHWAAFQYSFQRMRELLEEVGSGERGKPPASIAILSGDVHHAYLFDVAFRRDAGVQSRVVQAVCSPYRNPLDEKERRTVRLGFSRGAETFARGLARLAGAPDPGIRWRCLEGPYFDNQVATLRLDGREAIVRLDKTVAGEEDETSLEKTFERRIV
ncbi:MAG TPA: alkaline phosphatase D family protein [Solirubrobacterales bacterium]|nr:alkaline phosphatase D family protein [Solirubrobacterales bacterium]